MFDFFLGICLIILCGGLVNYATIRARSGKKKRMEEGQTATEMELRLERLERRLTDVQDVMISLSEKFDRWEGEPQPHLSLTDTASRNVLIFTLQELPGIKSMKLTVRPSGTEPGAPPTRRRRQSTPSRSGASPAPPPPLQAGYTAGDIACTVPASTP